MIKIWPRVGGTIAWAAVLALGLGGAADAGTVKVYANNPVTGDSFQGGQYGPFTYDTGQAVGSSGWYYTNVRSSDAHIGINGGNPYPGGNGSVSFDSGSNKAKADISLFKNPTQNLLGNYAPAAPKDGGSFGQLKDLTSLSYDWYRVSSSTTSLTQTVALKLALSNWDGTQKGEFVFEPYYTTGNVVSDTWVHEDVLGDNQRMWVAGSTLPKPPGYQYQPFDTFLDPTTSYYLGDFHVVGVTAGIGSGWSGQFTGYVDNITFGFAGGESTTYNFEVSPAAAVPEPAGVAMGLIAGGAGLAAAAWRRRRVG